MEKTFPRSGRFFDSASDVFDDSRRVITNKAAGKVVIHEVKKKKGGGAGRFVVVIHVGSFLLYKGVQTLLSWGKNDETERVKLKEDLKFFSGKSCGQHKKPEVNKTTLCFSLSLFHFIYRYECACIYSIGRRYELDV